MGKYDHICKLNGAENYSQWRRQMTLTLQGKHLWSHCSNGSNPNNSIDYAVVIPEPADSKAIMSTDWLAKDAQTKALIDHKVSTIVANLLSESQTVKQQWELLTQHYFHNNILSQYKLHIHVHFKKLNNADDATHYVGVFEDAAQVPLDGSEVHYGIVDLRFATGSSPMELSGKSFENLSSTSYQSSTWLLLCHPTYPLLPPVSASFTFEDAIKLLIDKANAIVGRQKLAGPGSEYVNGAIGGRGKGKVNPAMGICIHKNNPEGIRCTNKCCVAKSYTETHDKRHCYWPGGRMEDKPPPWLCSRTTKDKGETAAAVVPDPPTSSSSVSSLRTIHKRELFCAAISNMDSNNKLACLSTHAFATILDSGATSHLVKDKGYFLSFTHKDRPPVKTVNHGSLITTGHGTSIAEITLKTAYRIMLSDCLHAPGAMLNLSKSFALDNGREYISNTFTKSLQDAGIELQLASPYAHQQNGKAE